MSNLTDKIQVPFYKRVLFYIWWTILTLFGSAILGILCHLWHDSFKLGWNLW